MLKKPPVRVSFRKSKEIIDLPNLIEVQIKSYKEFLQAEKLPHEREKIGLEEVFYEVFPGRRGGVQTFCRGEEIYSN